MCLSESQSATPSSNETACVHKKNCHFQQYNGYFMILRKIYILGKSACLKNIYINLYFPDQ